MANRRAGNRIITTAIEHASVSNTMKYLEEMGFEVIYLNVDKHGIVDLEQFDQILNDDTILVSVMYVNNEIGSVQPIEKIADIIKKHGSKALLHVDAIQAFGKMRIYPKRMGIDLMSISGHKIHGPKGTGAVFVKDKTKIKPVIYGGGQQQGLRSGTENVPGYAGLGLATKLIYANLEENVAHMTELKNRLISQLTEIEDVYSNSGEAPHIASITFKGVRSEVMLHALEERGIYVSAGSACSSNKPAVSSTLKAIGLAPDRLESTLRFSFSYENTIEEVDYAVAAVQELLPVLRRYVRKK
jgi:cysteine desulfurase